MWARMTARFSRARARMRAARSRADSVVVAVAIDGVMVGNLVGDSGDSPRADGEVGGTAWLRQGRRARLGVSAETWSERYISAGSGVATRTAVTATSASASVSSIAVERRSAARSPLEARRGVTTFQL